MHNIIYLDTNNSLVLTTINLDLKSTSSTTIDKKYFYICNKGDEPLLLQPSGSSGTFTLEVNKTGPCNFSKVTTEETIVAKVEDG